MTCASRAWTWIESRSDYCGSRSRTGGVGYTHMRLLAKQSKATYSSRLTYTMNIQSYICLTWSGLGTTNSFTAGQNRKLRDITTLTTNCICSWWPQISLWGILSIANRLPPARSDLNTLKFAELLSQFSFRCTSLFWYLLPITCNSIDVCWQRVKRQLKRFKSSRFLQSLELWNVFQLFLTCCQATIITSFKHLSNNFKLCHTATNEFTVLDTTNEGIIKREKAVIRITMTVSLNNSFHTETCFDLFWTHCFGRNGSKVV